MPAIEALNLLVQGDAIQSIPEQYPSLFTGLGTLKGEEYKIQLQPGAKPFALNTPRNVALAQREQVRAELDRIESLGVISKVEKPTKWRAAMVVAQKKLRICVDF